MDPDTLGTKKLDSLSLSNKLLDRRNQKLVTKQKELEKDSKAKDCDLYVLKTLMNQYEANEEELLSEKNVDKESIEHYLKGEPKA